MRAKGIGRMLVRQRGSRPRNRQLPDGADGWTLRSADGSNTAHSEHTIAIIETGPRVLTTVG